MIQVSSSNWRHFRDWCCEMMANPTFDDSALHDDDRAVLKSASRWPSQPSIGQLKYMGSIASRVVAGLDDDCWTRDDLQREVDRRTRRTEFRQKKDEKMDKAVRRTDYVGKFNFLRADIRRYKLSAGDIAVLATIYDRTWSTRDEARIALSEFVSETGINKATVCRSLAKLADIGLFEVDHGTGGRNKRSTYRGVLRLAMARYSEAVDEDDDPDDGGNDDERDTLRDQSVAPDVEIDAASSRERDTQLYPYSRTHRSRPSASERAVARHRDYSSACALEVPRPRSGDPDASRSQPNAYERATARHRRNDDGGPDSGGTADSGRHQLFFDPRWGTRNPYWREEEYLEQIRLKESEESEDRVPFQRVGLSRPPLKAATKQNSSTPGAII